MSTFEAMVGVYFFVLLGFTIKRAFSEIHERTLVLVSVYCLQPLLSFWGILGQKIDFSVALAPFLYFFISAIGAIVGFFLFERVFLNRKYAVIVTTGGIIGNTGNLGIPLILAMYGKAAVLYAVIVNLANVFVLYGIGVFLFSLGTYSVSKALINIVKMPVIWTTLLAIILNAAHFSFPAPLENAVEMGAYSAIVIQLIIFGVFLGGLKKIRFKYSLVASTMGYKFVAMPLIAFCVLYMIPMDMTLKAVIFLQVCMPLAVNNVNFASLYKCNPYTVTANILVSAILFFGLIFIYKSVF